MEKRQPKNTKTSPKPTTPKSNSSIATKISVASAIVAALAAISSSWVAYSQFGLQTEQTKLQAEQNRVSLEQLRNQSLQSLPPIKIGRTLIDNINGSTTIKICGSEKAFQAIPEVAALWMPEIGRYPRPPVKSSEVKALRIAITPPKSDEHELALTSTGERCKYIHEPSWTPIISFINKHRSISDQFNYWFKSEAMVTVFQRDESGTLFQRHYLLTHIRADEAQLISQDEAIKWQETYREAISRGHSISITSPDSNIEQIQSFFQPVQVGLN